MDFLKQTMCNTGIQIVNGNFYFFKYVDDQFFIKQVKENAHYASKILCGEFKDRGLGIDCD